MLYFCVVQLRKRILGHFLLASYLLIVLHHSVSHSSVLELADSPFSAPSHKHEDFKEVHHEHDFHVGIFHFLEHFFESINHSNDFSDEHLIIVQKTETKKVIDHNNSINVYFDTNDLIIFSVDAESLPDPPYHLSLLQKLKLPNTPLRAPPALV